MEAEADLCVWRDLSGLLLAPGVVWPSFRMLVLVHALAVDR